MNETVLLTGISGWIAKHTAIELLNSGYKVLGTVRNSKLIDQTKKTINKYASIDKLSFVELDLLKDEGWDEALKGCKYVMHVASPFPLKTSRDRESLVPTAKDGTIRVYDKKNGKLVHRILHNTAKTPKTKDLNNIAFIKANDKYLYTYKLVNGISEIKGGIKVFLELIVKHKFCFLLAE